VIGQFLTLTLTASSTTAIAHCRQPFERRLQ